MSPPKSGWLFLGRMRNRLLLKLNHGVKVRPFVFIIRKLFARLDVLNRPAKNASDR
jgi:hypothetical protein